MALELHIWVFWKHEFQGQYMYFPKQRGYFCFCLTRSPSLLWRFSCGGLTKRMKKTALTFLRVCIKAERKKMVFSRGRELCHTVFEAEQSEFLCKDDYHSQETKAQPSSPPQSFKDRKKNSSLICDTLLRQDFSKNNDIKHYFHTEGVTPPSLCPQDEASRHIRIF